MKEVKKVWGKEVWIVNCPEYCGKLLYLDKGSQSSYHYHRQKKETFYCLEGQAALTIEGKDYMLNPFARSKTIEPGVKHSFFGLTNCIIIEVSTHHGDSDVVRLTESKAGGKMNDVNVSQVEVAHEDERRELLAIFNGDFTAKQVKVIEVKKDCILGNHYHPYSELFYVFTGEADYTLVLIKTGERRVVKLKRGDRLVIGPEIAHRAEMAKGTIMIEATAEPYTPESSVRYEIND